MFFFEAAETTVGDFEKKLLTTLDDLGIIRQAYHGNIFVGNHCKIIINNYKSFCKGLCSVYQCCP